MLLLTKPDRFWGFEFKVTNVNNPSFVKRSELSKLLCYNINQNIKILEFIYEDSKIEEPDKIPCFEKVTS